MSYGHVVGFGVCLLWTDEVDVDAGNVMPDELWVVALHNFQQVCRLDFDSVRKSEYAVWLEQRCHLLPRSSLLC